MKKKPILLSLLVLGVLAVVLTVGVVLAKYSTTFDDLPTIGFNVTQPDTYTYAVLDKDTGALSIRNRPAVINDGKLIDKDGTYDIATEVYALPKAATIYETPTGAIAWNTLGGTAKRENKVVYITKPSPVVSVSFADKYQPNSAESLFANFTNLTAINFTNFDTSNVTSMKSMFKYCVSVTTLDMTKFDTSNVTDMYGMFEYCWNVTSLKVTSFDTSKVTDMMLMFHGCHNLTDLNVSKFNTSQVTTMQEMFVDCWSLTTLDVSNFDTSNVLTFRRMFYNASRVTKLDVSNFKTGKATDMREMFRLCVELKSLDLSKFNTSNVTLMTSMFHDCGVKELNLSYLDTSKVTDMSNMFCGSRATKFTFGGDFTTENVQNMSGMFSYIVSKNTTLTTLDLSSFNTSNVWNMYRMFFASTGLTKLNLSSFNTSKVTNMIEMFSYTGTNMALKTIIVSNDFVVGSSTNTENMFLNAHSIVGGNGTKYIGAGGTYAIIDGVKGLPGYFTAPEHTHQGGDNWVGYVDELHGKYCSVYDEPLQTEDHTYVDGICSVCNYVCKHSKIELSPNDDGTTHSGTCPTCNTNVIEEHTYTDGVCSKCQYQCTHTISEGTIDNETHGGICTVCMIAVSGSHTYDNGITDDSGITTYTCSVCGHTKTETPSEDTTGNEENNNTEPEANGGGTETASNEQESSEGDETTPPANVSTAPAILPSESSEDDEGQQQDQQNEQE